MSDEDAADKTASRTERLVRALFKRSSPSSLSARRELLRKQQKEMLREAASAKKDEEE